MNASDLFTEGLLGSAWEIHLNLRQEQDKEYRSAYCLTMNASRSLNRTMNDKALIIFEYSGYHLEAL